MAFVTYIIGRKNKEARNIVAVATTLSIFVLMLSFLLKTASGTGAGELKIAGICGLGLHLKMDGFRALYTTIASFMWLVCATFSLEYNKHYHNRNRYYMFLLWTLGATMGVFLSADLFTTFMFFEMVSLTSYVWVAQQETKEALRAAETYLAVAVIGGLVMLMGLSLLYNITGTLAIDELKAASEGLRGDKRFVAAGLCIFWGFAAKAGAVPIHIWLPKAHPVAPAPASALLSGMLTKVGVFGILVVSSQMFYADAKWGTFVLVIGAMTMFVGAFLAVFSIDMKKTLACSSVSQIGFILTGIGLFANHGELNALAVRGTLLYMVNHSLFKLVLFLVAGTVFMNIHKLDFNAIKGFGRKKPLLKYIYLCAGLGIAGVPMFSGYVSKTLVHEAMVEWMNHDPSSISLSMRALEWVFLISGGMTLAYMTKLFIVVFVEKNEDEELQKKYDENKTYMNLGNKVLLTFSASLFILFGVLPNATFDKLADLGQPFMGLESFHETFSYFTLENLKGSAISIVIGVILYTLVIRPFLITKEGRYINPLPKWVDLEDYGYRPLLKFVYFLASVFSRVLDKLVDGTIISLRKTALKETPIPVELTEGNSVSHAIGTLFDNIHHLFTGEEVKPEDTYRHKFAMLVEKMGEANVIITRSLSFGLIFFCCGLVFTLIYMLWL